MKDISVEKSVAYIRAVLFPSIKEVVGPFMESIKKLYSSDIMLEILSKSGLTDEMGDLQRMRNELSSAWCRHKKEYYPSEIDELALKEYQDDEYFIKKYKHDRKTFYKLISDPDVMDAFNTFMAKNLSVLTKLQVLSREVGKEDVKKLIYSLSINVMRWTEEVNTPAFRTWVLNLNAYGDLFGSCGYDKLDIEAIKRIRRFLYLNARTRTQQLFGLAVSETQSKSSVAAFASIATACGLSLDGRDIAVRRRSLFAKAFQKSHAQKLFDLIVPIADQSVSPLISFIKFALIGYDAAMGESWISPVARLKSVKQAISKQSLACTCLLASQHAATPKAIAKFIKQYDALWENAVGDEKYNTSMSLEQIQALVQAYIHHHESVKAGMNNARDEIIRCVKNLGHDAVQEYAQDVSIMVQGQPKSPSKPLSFGAHQTEKKPHLLANSSPQKLRAAFVVALVLLTTTVVLGAAATLLSVMAFSNLMHIANNLKPMLRVAAEAVSATTAVTVLGAGISGLLDCTLNDTSLQQ